MLKSDRPVGFICYNRDRFQRNESPSKAHNLGNVSTNAGRMPIRCSHPPDGILFNQKISMSNRAQRTRKRIMDAALHVFARKGYHDTRMDDIVDQAQSSKGAVYFHFPGKEQLFLALIDEFARRLEENLTRSIAAEPRGLRRVRAALQAGLRVFDEYSQLAKIFLIQAVGLGQTFERKRLEILDRFAGLIQQYLNEAIDDGNLEPMDTQIVAYAWVGAINELVMRWIQTGEPARERIVSSLETILLRSIGIEGEQAA